MASARDHRSMIENLKTLNRAPFVLGLLCLFLVMLSLVVLIWGGWRWDLALIGLGNLLLGLGLLGLYYRLHRGN